MTYSLHRLMHFNCEGKNPRYAYPQLVKLYAKLGVHRSLGGKISIYILLGYKHTSLIGCLFCFYLFFILGKEPKVL